MHHASFSGNKPNPSVTIPCLTIEVHVAEVKKTRPKTFQSAYAPLKQISDLIKPAETKKWTCRLNSAVLQQGEHACSEHSSKSVGLEHPSKQVGASEQVLDEAVTSSKTC